MRKIILFSSLICFIIMGVDAFFNLLTATKGTQFPLPITLSVYLLLFIDGILIGIYIFRQELSIRQHLKQHGMEEITHWNLIKTKSTIVRPYRRETRLRYAMLLSIILISLLSHTMSLVASDFPTDYFTHFNDIIYQISLPIIPAILSLYVLFSRDVVLQQTK